jgi:hypothetical protein
MWCFFAGLAAAAAASRAFPNPVAGILVGAAIGAGVMVAGLMI